MTSFAGTALAPGASSLALLRPPVVLALWTFAMEAWMYATRIPAVSKYNAPVSPSATKAMFDGALPPNVRWKADNFAHLHEQPTVFYAIAACLALARLGGSTGPGNGTDVEAWLMWTYVGLRVVHSFVQAGFNKVMVRFSVFATSSVCLLALTLRAASAVALW